MFAGENHEKPEPDTPHHLRNREKTPIRAVVCLNQLKVPVQVFISGGVGAAPAAKT
jgi:hypothetical protein